MLGWYFEGCYDGLGLSSFSLLVLMGLFVFGFF